MKTLLLVSVSLTAVLLVGCGSSAGDGSSSGSESSDSAPLACQSTQSPLGGPADVCATYGAIPNAERSQWCTAPGDEVVEACPTADVWATCTYTNRLGTNVCTWYKDDPESTPDTMKSACDVYQGTLTFK